MRDAPPGDTKNGEGKQIEAESKQGKRMRRDEQADREQRHDTHSGARGETNERNG